MMVHDQGKWLSFARSGAFDQYSDDCVEVLDEAFVDLDGDGCSRLSNDADLDGDGVLNIEDACMTLSSTTKGVFLDEGCPVPKRLPLLYALLAAISALLFLVIRDVGRSNQATHTGNLSTDDYVDTVINIESMSPTAIIRLGQELGFDFKGSRNNKPSNGSGISSIERLVPSVWRIKSIALT